MPVYVITGDIVSACPSPPANISEGRLLVSSIEDLEKSDLPNRRLVAIWNGLPGAAKVTKFTDRKTAVRRLWAAFGKLPVTDEPVPPAAKAGTPNRKQRKSTTSRADTKQAKVIALLKRPGGATLEALTKATGWQRHTVRGAIAGALKKRLGLKVVAKPEENGARVYRIIGAGR